MAKKKKPSAPQDGEPLFGEVESTGDPEKFKIPHASDNALYKLINKGVQPYPEPRSTDPLELADVWGSKGKSVTTNIISSKKIVFHAVGDTGSTRGPKDQNLVTDKLVNDFNEDASEIPSFLFHLGDVVYSFGEGQYYYDQFYEPFRQYPAPILAIPGNHDGMVYKGDKDQAGKSAKSLEAFLNNFVTSAPVHTDEAGGLLRTSMIQPGVYFCIDAPFVSIIGLYSNVLEDPGVISSQSGKIDGMNDNQISFLTNHLKRIKGLKDSTQRAIIVAVHHPPFTSGGNAHGGSPKMASDMDGAFKAANVWPHAVLSGHAHNYQRYTRQVNNMDIPYIICGNSGHNVQALSKTTTIRTPKKISDELIFENYDDKNYGYLRIICDAKNIRIEYHDASPDQKSESDAVTVQLKDHSMISN